MSLSLVRTAVEAHIEQQRKLDNAAWKERHIGTEPRLFISDMGGCPRKAVWNALVHYPGHPLHLPGIVPSFSPYVQAIMRAGIVWEKETELALRAMYGDALQTQVSVRNLFWSGRPDFILPNNTIVEHKATNPYNFKAKARLPYRHHCIQVLAYQKILNCCAAAKLYYRGWADWAEFAVWDTGENIHWEGLVNGYYKEGMIEASLTKIMHYIETYWERQTLPPAYGSPTSEDFACTRKTKKGRYPNCSFIGECFPALRNVEGPFKA